MQKFYTTFASMYFKTLKFGIAPKFILKELFFGTANVGISYILQNIFLNNLYFG
jgi:hypothetical protein